MAWHARLQDYYALTKNAPPSPLLRKAISILGRRGSALDLGCGAGRDTRLLLDEGFVVTAVDENPIVRRLLRELPHQNRLEVVISSFSDFNFGLYDLVNAQWSLPFNPANSFNAIFTKLKMALNPGGVFVGQFFGIKDEWNAPDTKMAFHTQIQARKLLQGLEVLVFKEEKRQGSLADGTPKFWHVFHVTAQKPIV